MACLIKLLFFIIIVIIVSKSEMAVLYVVVLNVLSVDRESSVENASDVISRSIIFIALWDTVFYAVCFVVVY